MKVKQLALFLLSLPCASYAIDAGAFNLGKTFADTLKPTHKGEIVNPSGVKPGAWSSGTNAPTTPPKDMGAFSSPNSSPAMLSDAQSIGLENMGNKSVNECEAYVMGSDPMKDQSCAAINFLTNKCITPTGKQTPILTNLGKSAPSAMGCTGTYGASVTSFHYQDTISDSDPLFSKTKSLPSSAPTIAESVCENKTTVLKNAEYSIETCVTNSDTSLHACSESLSVTLTTELTAPKQNISCDIGYSLVDGTCQKTIETPADATYSCPEGGMLAGDKCISSVDTAPTEGLSCLGYGDMTPIASHPKFYWDVGDESTYDYPSGLIKYSDNPYYCIRIQKPFWYHLSLGAKYIEYYVKFSAQKYAEYKFPDVTNKLELVAIDYTFRPGLEGQTLLHQPMMLTEDHKFISPASAHGIYYGPAKVKYCPPGAVLDGGVCHASKSVTATVTGYTCPPGGTLSGQTCSSTTSIPTTIIDTCSEGLSLEGGQCKKVIVNNSWTSTCGDYKAATPGEAL